MVGRDELVDAVVRLAARARHKLAVVLGLHRQLLGPVHPVDARVDVVLVRRADLQDAADPLVGHPLPHAVLVHLDLVVRRRRHAVGDVDEALAEVLGRVY